MPTKPTVLVTGVSGNLGSRLVRELPDFQIIGVDLKPPVASPPYYFEEIDLAEERSCDQLLDLMLAYRPQAVVHLAFVLDPLRCGVLDPKQMWNINVAGTSRVVEAIAEHNRMIGGVEQFIFPSSAMVYGPELARPATEESAMGATRLPYALHQQEADRTVQQRSRDLKKCKTYLLRPQVYAGASVENYQLGVLRGVPGGKGRLAERLRRKEFRLPLLLPSRGNYMDRRFQFVHIDDMARLITHILHRTQADSRLTVLNVAGQGEPLQLRRCVEISGIEVRHVPARSICRQAVRFLWDLGVSDIPPEALPYLLGSSWVDTAKLRVFLGEHYRSVIQHTCEEALANSFRAEPHELAQAAKIQA